MGKILPVLLALIGLGAGVGTGFALRPADGGADAHEGAEAAAEGGHGEDHAEAGDGHGEAAADDHGGGTAAAAEDHGDGGHGEGGHGDGQPEYVELSNQFIVPVVEDGRVASMVILSLNLEVAAGSSETIYSKEPKLRDRFLQILFDHANAGGFRGSFTDGANLILLRRALLEGARKTSGDMITDVLIADIARQDS